MDVHWLALVHQHKARVFVDASRRVKCLHPRVFINLNPSIYHVIRVHKINLDETWKD